jgi:hypothetical protein
MQSAFELKNGIRMIVFTTAYRVCIKICNHEWMPIYDHSNGYLLEDEEIYHKSLRESHAEKYDLNPEHSTKFRESVGCSFDDENTFNPDTVKDNRGAYVRRSTYQHVVEENKKLLNDLRIISSDKSGAGVLLANQWREKFANDQQLNDSIMELILTVKN